MPFQPPEGENGWSLADISNITLAVAQANATSSYQYPDLKITSSSGSIGTATTGASLGYSGQLIGAYVVNGVIQNVGTQSATNLTVVGAFFNSTGAVVGVGFTDYLTPTVLAPGSTTTFLISAMDLNQSQVPDSLKIDSYSLLAQTAEPILQGTPIVSSSPSTSGTGSSTSAPSSTASSKTSIPSSAYVIVIAAVILVAAVAVAALVLRVRSKPHQTVKEARKARKSTR
jgi:hypothetical protein